MNMVIEDWDGETFIASLASFGRSLIFSALEGADVLCHYHPNEEQDAKDTVEYIKKVAPNAKVETYAKDLRTEKACLEMVEEVKKWSGGKLDILCVVVFSSLPTYRDLINSFLPTSTQRLLLVVKLKVVQDTDTDT